MTITEIGNARIEPVTREAEVIEGASVGVLTVDFGSTMAAFGYALILPDKKGVFRLSSTATSSKDWSAFAERIDTTVPGMKSYKCLRGDNLASVVSMIKGEVKSAEEALQEQDLDSAVFAITGFGHSLVVEWGEQGHNAKRVLLLDGPSLHSDNFTSKQREILGRIGFFENPNKEILSLMKLMTLRNNPNIVSEMCGHGVVFEDLRFSTMHGLVSRALGSSSTEAGVPLVDLRDLTSKDIAKDPADAQYLLSSLGISRAQISINLSPFSFAKGHHIAFRENDFVGVASLIKFAREAGVIYKSSVVIELDTIVKMMSKDLPFIKVSASSGEHYTTQRMGGEINSKWLWHLYQNMEGKIDFDSIAAILTEMADWPNLAQEFYYDPDDHTGGNSRGTLRHMVDGHYEILQPEDLRSLDIPNQKKATLAIVTGMFFGLRAKIDSVLPQGAEFPPTEFYGGLVKYGGAPWKKIIRQIFWKSAAFQLTGVDGFAASGLAAAPLLGVPVHTIDMRKDFISEQETNREEEYQNWRELTSQKI